MNLKKYPKSETKIRIIGLIILLLLITRIISSYFDDQSTFLVQILWFCNIASIIIAIECIILKNKLISSLLPVLIVVQPIWLIDQILFLFKKDLGLTLMYFDSNYLLVGLIMLAHLILIPLLFYLVFKFKYSKKAYKNAIIFLLPIFLVSYLFTDSNINCARSMCSNILDNSVKSTFLEGPIYFIIYTAMILVLTYITHRILLYFFEKKNLVE